MEYREFRAGPSEADGKLFGVAAPFNSETVIGDLKRGGWREEIAPGAFKKALQEGDTVLLCDHDMSKPLARKGAGTLRMQETVTGLEFDADPADTTYCRDLRVNIKAGNKGGMSIGFEPVKDDWYDDKGRPSNRFTGTRRILREVKLPETSIVTNPAYKDTSVFARNELLAEREARAERGGNAPGNGNKPYGNVKYADPKNGKYPIDTLKHIKAAWAYINVAKNAAKYPLNGVSLSAVKAKIKAAATKAGVKVSKRDVGYLVGYCPSHGFEPCGERRCKDSVRRTEVRIKKGVGKRVVQMQAELKQAIDLLSGDDVNKLPKPAQDAIALISSAKTHAGHIIDTEKLNTSDATRSKPKPDTSTSDDKANFALRVAEREFEERSRELDLS